MARIAGVDLPKRKRIVIALTYIYGIGRTVSKNILAKLNIDPDTKSDDLSEAEINNIPGVVTNGLFAMRAANVVLVGTPGGVRIRQ